MKTLNTDNDHLGRSASADWNLHTPRHYRRSDERSAATTSRRTVQYCTALNSSTLQHVINQTPRVR